MFISKIPFRCVLALMVVFVCASCAMSDSGRKGGGERQKKEKQQHYKTFNADSAYTHIARQVSFGPRVPGSEGHAMCRNYIMGVLESIGVDTVIVQSAVVEAFNGDKLPIANIIARINSEKDRRVLLAAHWDTRPWADNDENEELRDKPILGANDGGSGVGVLLEIARNLVATRPSIGVDLFFFDAEDYGSRESDGGDSDSWCLGSQYWEQHPVPYVDGRKPAYGILLDMVGGRDARFYVEALSLYNAERATLKVWNEAKSIGHGDIFCSEIGGAVTDDHIILTRAGIPTTDIIELNNIGTQSFPPTWHTHNDNMEFIDCSSLRAVGETVLSVIYKER